MTQSLTQVVIDYYLEDVQAWEDSDFYNYKNPIDVAKNFLLELHDSAKEEVQISNDRLDIRSLIIDLIDPDNWDEEDLHEIGKVIMNNPT